jgi:hypothetical protein
VHFLELPVEIFAVSPDFKALDACALDERQSNDLIARPAVELYSDGEDNQHQT